MTALPIKPALMGGRHFARGSPDEPTDEAQLEGLIRVFYDRVREDAVLGPIFNRAVVDWEAHLGKRLSFWSSVMLTGGSLEESPMARIMDKFGELPPDFIDRWVTLWRETTTELLEPPVAALLQQKSDQIAQELRLRLHSGTNSTAS